jgi:hypothetical protein
LPQPPFPMPTARWRRVSQTYTGISNITLTYRVVARQRCRVGRSVCSGRPSRDAQQAREYWAGCQMAWRYLPAACAPTSRLARVLAACGGQHSFLSSAGGRSRQPAAEEPHRLPYLVVVVPTCFAAEQMPPHVEAGPERHGALQIVGHEFAHITAGRHARGPPRQVVQLPETRYKATGYRNSVASCRQ